MYKPNTKSCDDFKQRIDRFSYLNFTFKMNLTLFQDTFS